MDPLFVILFFVIFGLMAVKKIVFGSAPPKKPMIAPHQPSLELAQSRPQAAAPAPSPTPKVLQHPRPRPAEDVADAGLYAWKAQWKKCLHSSVRGVSFNNDDGSSRQEIIRKCEVGELLALVRDPDNPHSVNGTAIKLVRQSGEMVGHVASEISEILADQMDRGAQAEARIVKITGGSTKAPTRGVNIVIGQNYAPYRTKARLAKEATV